MKNQKKILLLSLLLNFLFVSSIQSKTYLKVRGHRQADVEEYGGMTDQEIELAKAAKKKTAYDASGHVTKFKNVAPKNEGPAVATRRVYTSSGHVNPSNSNPAVASSKKVDANGHIQKNSGNNTTASVVSPAKRFDANGRVVNYQQPVKPVSHSAPKVQQRNLAVNHSVPRHQSAAQSRPVSYEHRGLVRNRLSPDSGAGVYSTQSKSVDVEVARNRQSNSRPVTSSNISKSKPQ